MFEGASAFNQDISKWNTSSATNFVSQWRELLICFVWFAHWRDWYILFVVIPWYSSTLLLHTSHRITCLMVQVPLIKILAGGILPVPPVLWVNDVNYWHTLYDVCIEGIGTFDLLLFHDAHLLCCFIHHTGSNVFFCKCV
jgi:surface protein